jgi:hypothetical protein
MSIKHYVKKGGSLTWEEKSVKYGQEILELLEAVWAPTRVAVMHWQGHQKGDSAAVWGNQKADREAK